MQQFFLICLFFLASHYCYSSSCPVISTENIRKLSSHNGLFFNGKSFYAYDPNEIPLVSMLLSRAKNILSSKKQGISNNFKVLYNNLDGKDLTLEAIASLQQGEKKYCTYILPAIILNKDERRPSYDYFYIYSDDKQKIKKPKEWHMIFRNFKKQINHCYYAMY